MIKIKYPKSNFESEYHALIKSYYTNDKLVKMDKVFLKLFGKSLSDCYLGKYTFLRSLTLPFNNLLEIAEKFEENFIHTCLEGKKYFKFKRVSFRTKLKKPRIKKRYDKKVEELRSLFPYNGDIQGNIAELFMKYSKELKLSTCYYCNIDYINSFNTLAEYRGILDFFNFASKEELLAAPNITMENINSIYFNRFTSIDEIIQKVKFIGTSRIKKIETYLSCHTHNHFTLDHFIDKGTYPLLALSLYNLVPSCYTCNTKLKGIVSLIDKKDSKLAPTHDSFSFDVNVKFKIMPLSKSKSPKRSPLSNNIKNITNEDDFILKLDINKGSAYHDYIKCFKLEGRYRFHKKEVLKLIEKSILFPDIKIEQMIKGLNLPSNLSNIDKEFNLLKKGIFGNELFEGELNEVPLTKLKRDIGKKIGII